MKFHIPEQSFTLDEGGYGRLRFEIVTDKPMDEIINDVPAVVSSPEVPEEVPAQTPEVAPEVSAAPDAPAEVNG